MPMEWLAVALVGVVALVTASTVGRRAGENADRRAGRQISTQARRRGPLGATMDLIDASVAMYAIRARLGWSTATRADRRAMEEQAAAMAQAEAIRRQRLGLPPVTPPTHLIVTGSAGGYGAAAGGAPLARSTLRLELVAAVLGLVAVVGIVIAIWPRNEGGGVLSASGTPGPSKPVASEPAALPGASDVTPDAAPAPATSASLSSVLAP